MSDTIQFVDSYQTALNAGTYTVTATLTAPKALETGKNPAKLDTSASVQLHVAGPRFFLPPTEVHSVFPPENGAGDYNNVLPHVVLERRTLPWERLVAKKKRNKDRSETLEKIPFLALLVFTEEEEKNGDVTATAVMSLADLGIVLEPGEKPTDKVGVIDISRKLLDTDFMPTGDELRLLAHGRERNLDGHKQQRAVVIANRLPLSGQRHTAHLVMLENRYSDVVASADVAVTGHKFKHDEDAAMTASRFVTLKSWQFTCTSDKPSLRGRLLGDTFTFDMLSVPKDSSSSATIEQVRQMSYVALRYHLRWGDRAHTLYHGPFAPSATVISPSVIDMPASAEGLKRLVTIGRNKSIFDVSLSAAWELGRLLMLRDQSVAMAYFSWRRSDAQLRARHRGWEDDGHLHQGDDAQSSLSAMPTVVTEWFRDRCECRGLPFEYLVPDARMLPENALRVFEMHHEWMKCLVSGALAVGRSGESDHLLEADYLANVYTGQQRMGFLLRSPAVDEHTDLDVMAVDANKIRLERIGPGLLFGLYEGHFSKLQFSLPPIGLHFGLKEDVPADGEYAKDVRNKETGKELKGDPEPVTFKSRGVVDIEKLSADMAKRLNSPNSQSLLTPGEFAFQMCEGTEMVEFGIEQGSNTNLA